MGETGETDMEIIARIADLLNDRNGVVIGAPIAWYASRKWMESFAGSIPLHWWVFLAAFAAVAALTSLIVICQSWRVANENPVKNLRAQ